VLSGKVKIEVTIVIRSRMPLRPSATSSAQDDRVKTILIRSGSSDGRACEFGVPGLFPEIEPRASGMLRLDAVHSMYWEESGDPTGDPRGFPARRARAGSTPSTGVFSTPAPIAHRVDQRGAGRSTPLGSCLTHYGRICLADLEALRMHLRVERWVVFGGSWGSTLAIAYAEAHPERCLALILRGIFLCRRSEIEWFLYGLRGVFPRAWEKFAGFLLGRSAAICCAPYHRR